MNIMHSFFCRVCHSPISRLTAVLLVALALGCLAACGRKGVGGGDIHNAAKAGDLVKVKALLKDHPDLVFNKDNDGRSPLHWAANSGHKDVVELLLTNKAEVNAKDNDGRSPLHWAASIGHKDMAELLLTNRAEVNATNNKGFTPLHYATAGGENVGFQAVAELLRQHGGHE